LQSIACFTLLFSPSTAHPAAASNATICDQLSTILPDKVFLPNTTSYSTSTQSYFFRNSRQSPECVVAPSSTEDVAHIIKAITAQPSVKFSIKSGGHSPNKGASNTDDGVTIDLGGMSSVSSLGGRWDVVSVGAGAKAVDAYRVLDLHNRTVIGGRVASIGFGGFLTGGRRHSVFFYVNLH
jgi:FAD/FMN-containing dehydrogenase